MAETFTCDLCGATDLAFSEVGQITGNCGARSHTGHYCATSKSKSDDHDDCYQRISLAMADAIVAADEARDIALGEPAPVDPLELIPVAQHYEVRRPRSPLAAEWRAVGVPVVSAARLASHCIEPEKAARMTDAELLGIPGVGPCAVERIRAAVGREVA